MALRPAAGLVVTATDTGRVLLLLRSELVAEPLTWGLPGGLVEPGETAVEAALREFNEETAYSGPVYVEPLGTVVLHTGRKYFVFHAAVPEEFEPVIDEEHVDGGWFTSSELPEPLHHGVAALVW
jgi:ADP-ribose pyrophosphatase YjhB (NUDIX family)